VYGKDGWRRMVGSGNKWINEINEKSKDGGAVNI
jgi:hypothetical protein